MDWQDTSKSRIDNLQWPYYYPEVVHTIYQFQTMHHQYSLIAEIEFATRSIHLFSNYYHLTNHDRMLPGTRHNPNRLTQIRKPFYRKSLPHRICFPQNNNRQSGCKYL